MLRRTRAAVEIRFAGALLRIHKRRAGYRQHRRGNHRLKHVVLRISFRVTK
jgi:hypothetical protein